MLSLLLATIENETDRAFLSGLYEDNYDAMVKKARSMLSDASAVEDVIQDTFLYFAKNLDKIYKVPCSNLPFFVVMCIKRKCLDYIRMQKTRSKHIVGSMDDEETHFEPPAPGLSTEEQALLKLDVETVRQAFTFLPESLKDVLRYKYLLEMTDKEIAKTLGVRETTVRSYLTRARQAVYRICKEKGYVEETT